MHLSANLKWGMSIHFNSKKTPFRRIEVKIIQIKTSVDY